MVAIVETECIESRDFKVVLTDQETHGVGAHVRVESKDDLCFFLLKDNFSIYEPNTMRTFKRVRILSHLESRLEQIILFTFFAEPPQCLTVF